MKIIIYCWGCRSDNKHKWGTPGYEIQPEEYSYFSDAVKHAVENPTHSMEFKLENESDEE